MPYLKSIKALALIICVLAGTFSACSSPAAQTTTYDPTKKYAAFAVVNLPASAGVLSTAKQQAIADGLEIGPIEYYGTTTTNFDPIVKKLAASKQVSVIWVIGGLMDVPAMRKSAAALGFAGTIRFNPVASQATPGQQ
jgi:hypothetical protein